jgi:hypothetical protein
MGGGVNGDFGGFLLKIDLEKGLTWDYCCIRTLKCGSNCHGQLVRPYWVDTEQWKSNCRSFDFPFAALRVRSG